MGIQLWNSNWHYLMGIIYYGLGLS